MAKKTTLIRKNATKKNTPRDLGWDELALILALTRERTMTGTGERLGVKVSTVARRLDRVEAKLEHHLFDRTVSGILPTELAESLAVIAENMERAHAEAMHLVAGHESEPEGTVRLTAPPGVANWLLAPMLKPLRVRYPRLQIELLAEVSYADLTRRDADLALRVRRPRGGDLILKCLAEQAFVPAVSPGLAKQHRVLDDPSELDWITWGADLAHMPDAQWIARHVPAENVALRTSSMDAQIHATKAGLGAMFLSPAFLSATGFVGLRLSRGLARKAPLPEPGRLWMITHRALRRVPRVAAVWSFLEEQIQRQG